MSLLAKETLKADAELSALALLIFVAYILPVESFVIDLNRKPEKTSWVISKKFNRFAHSSFVPTNCTVKVYRH